MVFDQMVINYETMLEVSFEAFTAVMIQVVVSWVVTPCGVVVGYQRFRGLSCLHLQSEVNAWRYTSASLMNSNILAGWP
jgi:hypothetical protein